MDRFQALTAFVRVVETGSFARAAQRLDVSVSAVSRQVAELESHLGARLLNRTTRRLSMTESGQAFYERCVQLLADLEEAEAAVSAATLDPRGTLRLTTGTTSARGTSRRSSRPIRRATRASGSTSICRTASSMWSRKASTSPCASATCAARH
jgi:DNA-binding transcriptional LysR family regulator